MGFQFLDREGTSGRHSSIVRRIDATIAGAKETSLATIAGVTVVARFATSRTHFVSASFCVLGLFGEFLIPFRILAEFACGCTFLLWVPRLPMFRNSFVQFGHLRRLMSYARRSLYVEVILNPFTPGYHAYGSGPCSLAWADVPLLTASAVISFAVTPSTV